jgi:hypothetical protein
MLNRGGKMSYKSTFIIAVIAVCSFAYAEDKTTTSSKDSVKTESIKAKQVQAPSAAPAKESSVLEAIFNAVEEDNDSSRKYDYFKDENSNGIDDKLEKSSCEQSENKPAAAVEKAESRSKSDTKAKSSSQSGKSTKKRRK